MIEVTQNKLHDPSKRVKGGCFQACLASILELPLDDVPHFVEFDDWLYRLQLWLADRGLVFLYDIPPAYANYWGYHLIGGPSPRGNFRHCVVGKAGEMIWDPHPDRTGLSGTEDDWDYYALALLDPSAFTHSGPKL